MSHKKVEKFCSLLQHNLTKSKATHDRITKQREKLIRAVSSRIRTVNERFQRRLKKLVSTCDVKYNREIFCIERQTGMTQRENETFYLPKLPSYIEFKLIASNLSLLAGVRAESLIRGKNYFKARFQMNFLSANAPKTGTQS